MTVEAVPLADEEGVDYGKDQVKLMLKFCGCSLEYAMKTQKS